ncbi:MAG: sugar phosphate nucleotidyltransferase [Thermoproteota archaeon]
MKALILAGGFGTRLRPLSCTRPKILFPIVNRPLLHRILLRLDQGGIQEVILAVDLKTELYIKQSGLPELGLKISYSRDPPKQPLGTGGPIKKAEKKIGHHDSFLVLNGDILAHLNYNQIIKQHRRKKAVATIALYPVEDPSRYGAVKITKDREITRFIEKPSTGSGATNLINAGIYVLDPEVFGYLPKDQKVSIERELFPKLAEEGRLYGHIFESLWGDMGTIKGYREIHKTLLDARPPIQKSNWGDGVKIKSPVDIGDRASIDGKSVIGQYTVLGRNVTVGRNVSIEDSIIFPGTKISDSSQISGAVIGEKAVIGKGAKIREGCILGDRVTIDDHVTLSRGVTVCAAKRVSESVLTTQNII